SMTKVFSGARNLIRVMPNTPSQIGRGVSTYCFGKQASEEDEYKIKTLLEALGTAHLVAEAQLHIATVLNGCGPALFFRLIELLAEAAERRGLSREQAITLASETGIGSLELLNQSNKSPTSLVREVVSPNGVTHALLTSLDCQELPKILDTAVENAVSRSIELSKI
ncbi:MAG: pyrroline-5-carboxylate reductase dimerization domain-containing protein, partial [Verrucomicrobiota bacterium]